jgi:hypothetical protein
MALPEGEGGGKVTIRSQMIEARGSSEAWYSAPLPEIGSPSIFDRAKN